MLRWIPGGQLSRYDWGEIAHLVASIAPRQSEYPDIVSSFSVHQNLEITHPRIVDHATETEKRVSTGAHRTIPHVRRRYQFNQFGKVAT